MKIGDLVTLTHESTPDLVGIVIDVNENPSPGLEPLPYRVHWSNPPDGYPRAQSLNDKWLEVISENR